MQKTTMVSNQFDRKFRDRVRKIAKGGQPSIDSSKPACVSEEVLRTVTLPPIPQAKHHKQNSYWPVAAKPVQEKNQLGPLQHRSISSLNFTFEPYTLADYKLLVSRTPAHLGGLGPSSMGSEEWCTAWRLRHKRLAYGLKAD